MFNKIAVFALTKNGIKLGKTLSRKIDNTFLFCNSKGFKSSVQKAFNRFDGLIFIMAAGIVVRTIAPFLKNKAVDPAVVVMDEKGRHVISLLSGHLGGANKLAKKTANAVGAKPVITTATDVNNLPCIEALAERFNLAIGDVKKLKKINSAIVNSRMVAFIDENEKRLEKIKGVVGPRGQGFRFCKSISKAGQFKADVNVIISHASRPRYIHSRAGITRHGFLLLHPKDLAVGIGCDRGVTSKEVEEALQTVLKRKGLSFLSVRNLASIDVKKNEKGLLRFAKKHSLKIDFYSKEQLAKMPLPSGFSEFVMGRVGVGGVCEPAALKSAGTKEILVKKQKSGRVTIAVAQIPYKS